VTPGTPYDAKGLLKSAIRDDNPVLVLEGEMLYNTKGEVPDEEYTIPIGQADLKREGEHCSIITSGKDGARGDAGGGSAGQGEHPASTSWTFVPCDQWTWKPSRRR